RIFIAFSRLSRTSTSTGLPNAFSIRNAWNTGSSARGQASALRLVEERDGQAVELRIGALGDDLVDDVVVGVRPDPVRDDLAQELALLRLRRREDLHARHIEDAEAVVLPLASLSPVSHGKCSMSWGVLPVKGQFYNIGVGHPIF